MRCKVCNNVLNDYELTRKDPKSGEFLDTCGECIRSIREALQDFEESPYQHDVGFGEDENVY